MNFEEFKKRYVKLAKKSGLQVTEEEIAKLFTAQVVISTWQNEHMKKQIRKDILGK
jgi:hypothetical protein